MAETIDRLMRAVKPPDGEAWHEFFAIHGHLLSAASCLAHSRFLLGSAVPRRSSWGFNLYDDLLRVVSPFGYVVWHHSENTTLFGLEVFLNAAQSSIAAAVDAATNAWILGRMEDVEERTSFDEQLLGLWIGVRLRILGSVISGSRELVVPSGVSGEFPWFEENTPHGMERSAYLRELWRTFERYSNTIIAQQEIHTLAGSHIKQISWPPRQHVDEDREEILGYLWEHMHVNKAGSAALVLARMNAFKHLTKGVSDRYDFVYAIEWVLTAKALEWISAFWRTMIADVRQPQTQPETQGVIENATPASK